MSCNRSGKIPKGVCTVEEIAIYYGISRKHVYRLLNSGLSKIRKMFGDEGKEECRAILARLDEIKSEFDSQRYRVPKDLRGEKYD